MDVSSYLTAKLYVAAHIYINTPSAITPTCFSFRTSILFSIAIMLLGLPFPQFRTYGTIGGLRITPSCSEGLDILAGLKLFLTGVVRLFVCFLLSS